MKRYLLALFTLVVPALAGCGGTDVTSGQDALAERSDALVSCSVTCSTVTLSCQGTACSASDGAYVQCDGVYQYCPTNPPPTTCSRGDMCVNLNGQSCAPNAAQRACCLNGVNDGGCYCAQGTWMCTIPVEPR
ncbi:hypothetical protein JQX13_31490 [Archangium violaceum]|uniref:hypothetical protein n=1 Tax=Archangium violaceum TaxID=83451 RepID=UPI00193BFF3F|nr:hypothetical protein [Archangium violaceum]QRK04739.1 hypothetical protein JQX13_31490 [Archangium violaceum]